MRATYICTFCDAADQIITVKGKKVRFDFSERFGPLVLDDEGQPTEKQPIHENDPFWEPFNAWLGAWERNRARAANTQAPAKPEAEVAAQVAGQSPGMNQNQDLPA